MAVDGLPRHRRCDGGSVNGLLVSRGVDVPAAVSRADLGRDARGIGAAPGVTIEPGELRTWVDVSGRGAGPRGDGKPNDVSTGFAPGSPGAPGVVGYGSATGMHVAIGSVPARK